MPGSAAPGRYQVNIYPLYFKFRGNAITTNLMGELTWCNRPRDITHETRSFMTIHISFVTPCISQAHAVALGRAPASSSVVTVCSSSSSSSSSISAVSVITRDRCLLYGGHVATRTDSIPSALLLPTRLQVIAQFLLLWLYTQSIFHCMVIDVQAGFISKRYACRQKDELLSCRLYTTAAYKVKTRNT